MAIFGAGKNGSEWWFEVPFAPMGECALPKGTAIRDLNGDGQMDLLLAGSTRDCTQGQRDSRAAIWWVLGLGGRQFSELHTFHGASGGEFSDIDLADLDGDGALEAAVRYFDGSQTQTVFLSYDRTMDTFVTLPGSLPAGAPTFARLDGDAQWDLLLADVDGARTQVYRGFVSPQFQLVQELEGAGLIALGRVFSTTGLDLLAVNDHGPQIMVWPNLFQPSAVGTMSADTRARLSVIPSIASARTEVRWVGMEQGPCIVQVIDASGRALVSRRLSDRSWVWDLRDDGGSPARSGIYWIRVTDPAGRVKTGRLTVVR